jgi:uncharacterized protein YwqG
MADRTFSWPLNGTQPRKFLAQINLGDLPKVATPLVLPGSGYLLFFADDGDVCVVHFQPNRPDLVQVQPPAQPAPKPVSGWRKLFAPASSSQPEPPYYKRKDVAFEVISNYPCPDSDEIEELEKSLEESEIEEIFELSEKLYKGKPQHHLFGFPEPIQNGAMQLECEAVLQGVQLQYEKNELAPHLRHLLMSAADWHLLLQFDSDDDIGFMWGDVGKLYFWMKKQDAQELAFDRVQLVSQCH